MVLVPIDRSFQTTWERKGTHNGHTVWHPKHAQSEIHGTRVAVDFDSCTGCLKCIKVCPEAVFIEWRDSTQSIKADPADEDACLECLACELVCPVDAIYITRTPSQSDTLSALLE